MERWACVNELPGVEGEMSSEFDVATGHVRTRAAGFWSMTQSRAFFNNWDSVVKRIHRNHATVSALVDMSESGVQQADVAAFIAVATTDLYREGDAVAMLVSTNLAKMQMRRVLDLRFHEFFVSRSAAETWLKGRSSAREHAA